MSAAPRTSARVAPRLAAEAAAKAAAEAAKKKEIEEELKRKLAAAEAAATAAAPEETDIKPVNEEKFQANLAKQEKNWKSFSEKRRDQKTTQDAISELFTIGQRDLALMNFGPRYVALWETNYPNDLVRGIFELADVDEQCNQTVGAVVPGETICWICGMPIWAEQQNLPCKADNGLSPECEHVLPIAQAAVFLQLYDKTNYQSDLFKFEYDWSHKTCNQTKNDDVYFKTETIDKRKGPVVGPDNLPIFDEEAVKRLLAKIHNTDRSDGTCDPRPAHKRVGQFYVDKYSFKDTLQDWVHFRYLGKGSYKRWEESRVGVFRAKYQAVLDFIGGTNFKLNPQTYILSLASAIAEIVNRQDNHRRPRDGRPSVRRQTLGYKPPANPEVVDKLKKSSAAIQAAVFDDEPFPAQQEPPAEYTSAVPPPPPRAADTPPKKVLFPPPYKDLPIPTSFDHLPAFLLSDVLIDESAYEDTVLAMTLGSKLRLAEENPAVDQPVSNAASKLSDIGGPATDSQAEGIADSQAESGYESDYGGRRRRTRRRTSSFLPHRRRRSHHAMRTSSRRRPAVGMAASF
jgi:hypothetical protein